MMRFLLRACDGSGRATKATGMASKADRNVRRDVSAALALGSGSARQRRVRRKGEDEEEERGDEAKRRGERSAGRDANDDEVSGPGVETKAGRGVAMDMLFTNGSGSERMGGRYIYRGVDDGDSTRTGLPRKPVRK